MFGQKEAELREKELLLMGQKFLAVLEDSEGWLPQMKPQMHLQRQIPKLERQYQLHMLNFDSYFFKDLFRTSRSLTDAFL